MIDWLFCTYLESKPARNFGVNPKWMPDQKQVNYGLLAMYLESGSPQRRPEHKTGTA
jgi:hypothetical protein